MTATTTEVSADIEYVDPITEDSTKKEILAHLREYHYFSYSLNSKSLKRELLSAHRRHHDLSEGGAAAARQYFKRPHSHLPSVSSFDGEGDPFEAVQAEANKLNIAPGSLTNLSANDRRALEKIIKSDYDNLLEQVASAAVVYKAQRRDEIEAEWRSRVEGRTVAQAELAKAVGEAQAKLNGVMDKLASKGYAGRYGGNVQINVPELVIKGRDEALSKVAQETAEAERRARSIIVTKRNAALRSILLATISAEAVEAAASTVPSVNEVMIEAQRQARLAITAGPSPEYKDVYDGPSYKRV